MGRLDTSRAWTSLLVCCASPASLSGNNYQLRGSVTRGVAVEWTVGAGAPMASGVGGGGGLEAGPAKAFQGAAPGGGCLEVVAGVAVASGVGRWQRIGSGTGGGGGVPGGRGGV
ncbi:hypothetical protein GUJ93_ZPchr0012g20031 [Zizania palustris]|uniref:Uncharacterized protein n=1 Tax=Zizania palustris TaxID=103762 RepID=A0A8J6BTA8_ZIZPA|nr:hypothetical protein GUJ93_ZPchr0012g20031 [Zizania palustris]